MVEVALEDISEGGDPHFVHSVLRERIVEHVFTGDLLRRLWSAGIVDIEVLRSEFDAGGFDLVVGCRRVMRHIQFKTTRVGGKAANVKVSLKLADKPSGCVIWIIVTDDLQFESFLWFGAEPGEPLPDLNKFSVAKHTKGNSDGVKLERPNHRVIPKGQFKQIGSLDHLIGALFGYDLLAGQ